MWDKIKQNYQYVLDGLLGLMTLLFFIERSRKDSDAALLAEDKTKDEVTTIQKQVDSNDAQIAQQEQVRKEIEQTPASQQDPTDFLNDR
jgi:hypothetical protein